MNTVLASPRSALAWPALAAVLLALVVMYVPVYVEVVNVTWASEDEAHGPLIILVSLWLAWGRRQRLLDAIGRPGIVSGSVVLVTGLLAYVVGVSQDIVILQLLSQILVLTALVLLLAGRAALRVMAFPLLFLLFILPLPPFVFDAITQPLKTWVSWASDEVLYFCGYPIAREGVILSIGQYQLLVADACSGLRSLVSLSALGILFVYLTGRSSRLHNVLMLASIVPLALLANLVRVIALVLITYHLGDEAGQGYLHGTAGMVMFTAAMLGLIGLDLLLDRLLGPGRVRAGPRSGTPGVPDASGM